MISPIHIGFELKQQTPIGCWDLNLNGDSWCPPCPAGRRETHAGDTSIN